MSACNNFCPVWSECGYEYKGHCDCVQQRKFKPAPQAQEETRGAPAPAGLVWPDTHAWLTAIRASMGPEKYREFVLGKWESADPEAGAPGTQEGGSQP